MTTTSCNIRKCCMKKLIIFRFKPTTPNTSQYDTSRRKRVAKRTQHVAPNNVQLRYVALKCCDRLARALVFSGFSVACLFSRPLHPLLTMLLNH